MPATEMRSSSFPRHPCSGTDDDRFTCSDAPADGCTAAWIRDEFATWLRRRTGLDETRVCDVVLSVNEALANAAEFAYLPGTVGTVDVEAIRDRDRSALTVTVADQGHWREPDLLHRQRRRGRGIPLMCTLADATAIETSERGTTVCMRFDDVKAGRPAADVIEQVRPAAP